MLAVSRGQYAACSRLVAPCAMRQYRASPHTPYISTGHHIPHNHRRIAQAHNGRDLREINGERVEHGGLDCEQRGEVRLIQGNRFDFAALDDGRLRSGIAFLSIGYRVAHA
eukprot:3941344-Rhodomonas_salina.3